jgi:hypothetical protein
MTTAFDIAQYTTSTQSITTVGANKHLNDEENTLKPVDNMPQRK